MNKTQLVQYIKRKLHETHFDNVYSFHKKWGVEISSTATIRLIKDL